MRLGNFIYYNTILNKTIMKLISHHIIQLATNNELAPHSP